MTVQEMPPLAEVVHLADRRAAKRLESAAARRLQAQDYSRHLRLVPEIPHRKTSPMNREDQPTRVQDRVQDEVTRRMSEGNRIAWRSVAYPLITALLLVVYYQSTTANHGGVEDYVLPVVLLLSGLLSAGMTLRVPMWVGGRYAARDVEEHRSVDNKPSMVLRVMSVTPAVIGWLWTLSIATGSVILGGAMVVAMLPVLVFVTDTVLQVAFTAFHSLPTQVAIEIMDEDRSLFLDDDALDAEADAAVLEHEAEHDGDTKIEHV